MITSEYGDGDEDYVDTSLGLHFPRLQFDDDGADVHDDYEDDDDDRRMMKGAFLSFMFWSNPFSPKGGGSRSRLR